MTSRTVLRHIIGYLVGISLFVVGIPFGLYLVSANLDVYLPIELIAEPRLRIAISLLIAGTGIVFMVWSNLWLFFVGKGGPTDAFGIHISPRSQHLVTSGPYRYTRNPMMFGAISFYLGLAVFFKSTICLGLVAILLVVASIYLKRVEERRLLQDFGHAYEQYRRQVSRLVLLPPRRKPPLKK